MTQVFASILGPVKPWRLQGVETARTFELVTACGLAYNTGSPDILPAGTAAAVAGGGVVMDLTAADYVIYTVQGSNTLSATTEATVPPAGTYALLWRVTLQGVDLYQQAGGSGGGGGIAPFSFVTKTGDYTITTADEGIAVDASGGAVTITVPTAIGSTREYTIKRVDATYATNSVTLVPAVGGQTIEFLAAVALISQGHSLVLGSDGANWLVASSHYADPAIHQGALVAIDVNGVPHELPIGTAGDKLTVNAGQPLLLDYE